MSHNNDNGVILRMQGITKRFPGVTALKDVSFEVRKGEILGIIGMNGAGKSTLLKLINGIIKPDAGSIAIRGRMQALIELGMGFNPILSGRENITVNASILNIPRALINERIDQIIEFSELGEFIDAPVQSVFGLLQFVITEIVNPELALIGLEPGPGHAQESEIASVRGE